MGRKILAVVLSICITFLCLSAALIDMVNGGYGWAQGSAEAEFSSEAYSALGLVSPVKPSSGCTPEEEQHIWDFLLDMTGNPIGAAALMGNLCKESGLSSTNMENGYEGELGFNDQTYTMAVDNGTYDNFVHDAVGYGLAQWTYWSRKQRLYDLAQSKGTSIGDLDMQLELVKMELSGSSILTALQTATSIQEASDVVLVNYENPKNQSLENKLKRASACQYFYEKYSLGFRWDGTLTQKQMEVIEIAMNSASYGIKAEAGYCQRWAAYVYAKAGLPVDTSCCAYHSGMAYGVSSNWDIIPPGAAVYGYSNQQYGHVGIYVGNGLVYHNVGGVAVDTLSDWIRKYKGFCWGWEAGSDLTKYD